MTMADVRRHGEIQRAVFEVLLDHPDGLPVAKTLTQAEAICPATPAEDEEYANQPGVRRYPKMQRFGTIGAVKAGWLVKDQGVWRLTDSGRTAYATFTDAEAFEREARLRYQKWKAQQPSSQFDSNDAEDVEAALLETGGVAQRNAWLVRGANVSGVDLVPAWLEDDFCSIQWVELPEIAPGSTRAQISAIVQAENPNASPQSRASSVGNLHRFLNEMEIGDLVATVDGRRVYVGEVAGGPIYTGKKLVTRTRKVHWSNAHDPFERSQLSAVAADGLRGQQAVSSLTAHAAEFATLGGLDLPDPPAPDVFIAEPGSDLAEWLLLPLPWLRDTVDLLNDKRQIVLYGPPGTGKTYVAQELCEALVNDAGGDYEVVQFHPSYAYEDFFEGLRPRLSGEGADGAIGFSLVHGPLRRMAARAADDPGSPYVLIIDEINRANLAKVFGELYFLLEYRGTSIALQYSEESFALPRNLFVIGTMNTADRSIALVDAAMRRRFYFQKLFPTESPIKGLLSRWLAREGLPMESSNLLIALNSAISDPDFAVGPSYLMSKRVADEAGLQRIWRNAILPLLEEYYFGEGRDIEGEFGLAALRARLSTTPQVEPATRSGTDAADTP